MYENSLQLLDFNETSDIDGFAKLISQNSAATLIALDLAEATLAAHAQPFVPLCLPPDLQWETLGWDVCDINGFFSYLDMSNDKNEPIQLFREDALLDAFALSEAANLRIPSHSPFVVVKIKKLSVG